MAQSNSPPSDLTNVHQGQLGNAIAKIVEVVADGLRHGHFEYSISCKIGTGGRREMTVAGGLSHKITIPESELPR